MITELQAKNAKPKDRPYMVRDDRGLYLRVDPTGRKYWIFRYWEARKEHRLSLGAYPMVTLREAREKRDDIQRARARGEPPRPPSRAAFGDVVTEWLRARMDGLSHSYLRTVQLRLHKYILPQLGTMHLDDITPGAVLKLCRKIEAAGYVDTAHRVKDIIGAVYRFAIASDMTDTDPTASLQGALMSVSPTHYATLTEPRDIHAMVAAMMEYRYPVMRAALLFSVLTFARPGEIRQAEWQEIDLDAALWSIPARKMKMKRSHVVPLARQAMTVLSELREWTGGERYLFPSARGDGRPMSPDGVRVALRTLGYTKEQITPHGFRAMASTLLNENGWPPDVIERQLAHAERNQVRAAYNHAEYLEERRKMMQWWADWLDGLAASPPVAGPTSEGRGSDTRPQSTQTRL